MAMLNFLSSGSGLIWPILRPSLRFDVFYDRFCLIMLGLLSVKKTDGILQCLRHAQVFLPGAVLLCPVRFKKHQTMAM